MSVKTVKLDVEIGEELYVNLMFGRLFRILFSPLYLDPHGVSVLGARQVIGVLFSLFV